MALVALSRTTFQAHGLLERRDLQRLLRDRVEIIAPDVLVIKEEFSDWEGARRSIDLLGIDQNANLVVIELKRTEDGGHMELQALRYAAMVSKMTFDKLTDVFAEHLKKTGSGEDARQKLLDFVGWEEPDEERFAQEVRIVLAAAEFSRELTTTVLWLNEYGLDIRCVRLQPYSHGASIFVDVQQILPLPETAEYFVKLSEKRAEERKARSEGQWSGLWFVNVGMSNPASEQFHEGRGNVRHWMNCTQHGYLAAGNGARFSQALQRLPKGAPVVAYQAQRGYVGYGIVTTTAQPIQIVELADGRTLAETLNQQDYNNDRPQEKWEYAVRVDWQRTFDLNQAKRFDRIFANPNVVCKLNHPLTVNFVRQQFHIEHLEP